MKYQRRQWQPTPVLLPGKSHGRRSLVGCSPWGREESDMTERLHSLFSIKVYSGRGFWLSHLPKSLESSRAYRQYHNINEHYTKTWVSRKGCCCCKLLQSCPTLHDPMDCSPPGSSVHGILQARILEWVAIAFSDSLSAVLYSSN